MPVLLSLRGIMRLKRKSAVLVILYSHVDYTTPKVLIYKELEGYFSHDLYYGLIGDYAFGDAGGYI